MMRPAVPAITIASGVRNASCGRYSGLNMPLSSVRSPCHAPGSIMNPRIETISAIVTHEATARTIPSRTWARLRPPVQRFHVR